MFAFLQIILLLIALSSFALLRLSLFVWTPILAILLAGMTFIGDITYFLLVPLWIILIVSIIFYGINPIRKFAISKPMLKFVRKSLPPMSVTERIAIEAGDVWWEGELFCGNPNWKKLHSYQKPTLTNAEQSFIDNQVETLCSMIDDWKIVREQYDLPREVWDYIKKEKFWGLVIEPEFGGLGFSALAHSTIITKIASRSCSAAITVMVPNSLGPGELIYRYGTDAQKKHYLPRLAEGLEIPCFALTGTEIGSDASGMPDKGIICKGQFNGEEIVGIKLSWDKRYITLAPIATILGLAFKLYDPDNLLGDTKDLGITLALIPTTHAGVIVGDRHIPMNMAFMNGPTHGKDVFIPIDWIIGGAEMIGQGWRMLMECLSIGRGISLPALATSSCKLSYCMTGAYAHIRKQFKVPIGNFEGVAEAMARIAGFTYMLEASRVFTTTAIDQHIKPAIASAIAKYHMTELGRKVVDAAMDVHAGRAVQLGPRNYMGNVYQPNPLSITVEGANILTRCLIIFGQGAIRCHPFLLAEIAAASDQDNKAGLTQFDKLLKSHIGYTISNTLRSFIYGLTGGHFIAIPFKKHPLKSYYRQLTRMSAALAVLADFAMLRLGGQLKRKETISARLGDILSYLYLASALLKYYEDQQRNKNDLPYLRWTLQYCLYQMQTTIEELLLNFPFNISAFLLRKLIFPYGRAYHQPRDKIGQQMVKQMMEPNEMRDRIMQHCFIGKNENDATGRMEITLQKLMQVIDYDKRIQAAIRLGKLEAQDNYDEQINSAVNAGVIIETEAQLMREYNHLRIEAIKVDSFAADYFK